MPKKIRLCGGKMKKRNIERPGISEIVSRLADIPADVLSSGMTLELRGRNELLLCGCREILEYSCSRIKVVQGACIVCVIGRRLVMSSYSDGRICIGGEIDAIDLCGGEHFEKSE